MDIFIYLLKLFKLHLYLLTLQSCLDFNTRNETDMTVYEDSPALDTELAQTSSLGLDRECAATPSSTYSFSSSGSSILQAEGKKGSKRPRPDAVENGILDNLKKPREDKSSQHTDLDEDELFGRQITAIFRRFTKQQKAIARLKIQQVLLETEFGSTTEPMTYTYYSCAICVAAAITYHCHSTDVHICRSY
jgi:hypothetical protein